MTRMQWQVINKLGSTQHKQTHTGLVKPLLWNMHMTEFLVVTACGLDITVQGHFLRCAPLQLTPPPPHFLYTQTKAASLGKVLGHFCFYIKPAPCSQADSLVDTVLFTNCRALQHLPDALRCWRCPKKTCNSAFSQAAEMSYWTQRAAIIPVLHLWYGCWIEGFFPWGFKQA